MAIKRLGYKLRLRRYKKMDTVISRSTKKVDRTIDITRQIEEIDLFQPRVTKARASRLKLDTGIDIEAEHRELRRKIAIEDQKATWTRMQREYPRIGRSITGLTGEVRRVTYIEDPWNIFARYQIPAKDEEKPNIDVALIRTRLPNNEQSDVVLRKGREGGRDYTSVIGEVIGLELAQASQLPIYRINPYWDKQKAKTYAVMERAAGRSINELAYKDPDVLETNNDVISHQLGRHAAFSYVFGIKDGYQTNYIFDDESKVLTRVDKERSLEFPANIDISMPNDPYSQEIAVADISNLDYIPTYRNPKTRKDVADSFETGFFEQYDFLKKNKDPLLRLIKIARNTAAKVQKPENPEKYAKETEHIIQTVSTLIDQDPREVLKRLYEAKEEVDRKKTK